MHRYTIFFIIVNALYCITGLLAATASSRQTWHIPDAVCTVLELLMMGGETARNMYSTDNNKEHRIQLHLSGCALKNTLTMHDHMNVKFDTSLQYHQTSRKSVMWEPNSYTWRRTNMKIIRIFYGLAKSRKHRPSKVRAGFIWLRIRTL
jgi:hypothetical protein